MKRTWPFGAKIVQISAINHALNDYYPFLLIPFLFFCKTSASVLFQNYNFQFLEFQKEMAEVNFPLG